MPHIIPFVEAALSRAKTLEKQGELAQAESVYKAILDKFPSDKRAAKRLRDVRALQQGRKQATPVRSPGQQQIDEILALYRQARLPEALAKASALSERFPGVAPLSNILGAVNARMGRWPEAIACYQKALSLKPDYAEVHNNLGNTFSRLGKHQEAIDSFRAALRAKPEYAEAHNGLGNALHKLARYEEAIDSYRQALEIAPGYAEVHNNLGNTLFDMGRLTEALASFARAVQINPALVAAHNNMGNTFRALGRMDEALASFAEAIRLSPDYAGAHSSLGNCLNELGQHERAIESIRHAIRLKPDFPEAHANLGNALSDLGRHEEALSSYRAALEIQPGFAQWHNSLGNALYDLGRYEEAAACHAEALRLKPDFAEAHYNLSLVKTYTGDDTQLAQMLSRLASPGLPATDAMHLRFALGKACEDLGDMEQAFTHLLEANRLKKKALAYDIGVDREQFMQIKSIFAAAELPVLAGTGAQPGPARQAICIVGMPRSGTTLVEQILASHSQVHGGGERTTLGRILSPVLREMSARGKSRIEPGLLKSLADTYLGELQSLPTEAPYITDKMPGNFKWIGFLLAAVPGVKIINLQRDPAAICWSIFKRQFGGTGNGYAYDLVDVAEYFKLYDDLMDFWRREFPGRVFDLNYELLTEHQEQETRRLLEYCGLDWEPACLEFHTNRRAVQTLSGQQVRKAMYTGSSDAWRKVEAQLQPMLQVLGRTT